MKQVNLIICTLVLLSSLIVYAPIDDCREEDDQPNRPFLNLPVREVEQ